MKQLDGGGIEDKGGKIARDTWNRAEDLNPVFQPANIPMDFAQGRSHVMRSVFSKDN